MTALPPLIALASGQKVRPRKATTRPLEIHLRMAVAKLLREHCLPDWQRTHIAHGEVRDIRTAIKLKNMGLKRGWPDFVLIPSTGQLHCLELKRLGEKLSENQVAYQAWCIRHGVPHPTYRTLDEALTILDAWGCLRIELAGLARKGGEP